MSKTNPPTDPFTFEYNYDEELPYTYNVLPLNDVVATLAKHAGANKVKLSPKDWLKTEYSR
ncbi:hypothetical protein [Domibacillus sp.]|uniref:hypothetical protein n=1 Tax=Domibacillus sp. TaxID=1969783 RepID=UPI00281174A5|nr:hypothetical protein [Domibacillus sp.]